MNHRVIVRLKSPTSLIVLWAVAGNALSETPSKSEPVKPGEPRDAYGPLNHYLTASFLLGAGERLLPGE